jgi:hypothetical protein
MLQQVDPAGQQVVCVPNELVTVHTWPLGQHVLPLMQT